MCFTPPRRAGHFNPRSPHGERPVRLSYPRRTGYFNPRSPHGERHHKDGRTTGRLEFQPTLPARGATRRRDLHPRRRDISTHAPRTGSDSAASASASAFRYFNPRSPHGERLKRMSLRRSSCVFQPTLPARGATPADAHGSLIGFHFNPRSPHGERPGREGAQSGRKRFQPTLPARGATMPPPTRRPRRIFQPTLPTRGATKRGIQPL